MHDSPNTGLTGQDVERQLQLDNELGVMFYLSLFPFPSRDKQNDNQLSKRQVG